VSADREPVVDAAQGCQDVPFDACFLGDLADCCLLVVLFAFRVAFRQAPLEPAAPVKAGDDRHLEVAVGGVHHYSAGAYFLNGGK
jgi:hypothetical protein